MARSQTASASVILFATGYMLGGGDLFSWGGLVIVIFAILSHWTSFGQNTIADSAMKYDLSDTETVDQATGGKSHHPIISGRVPLREAYTVFIPLLTGLIVAGAMLPFLFAGNTSLALLSLAIWVSFGVAYNGGMSIYSVWKFLFISVCFGGMFIFGFFLEAGSFSTLAGLCALFVVIRAWFQNGYSGEMKDLEAPEDNMLRRMGARLEKRLGRTEYVPGKSRYYAWALTLAELGIGMVLFVRFFSWTTLPFVAFFASLGLYFTHGLTLRSEWNRSDKLLQMSLAEICWIYLLPVALAPALGYLEVLVLLVFGVLYFFGICLAIWGKPYPKV